MTSPQISNLITFAADTFPLCCWSCGTPLDPQTSTIQPCSQCGTVTLQQEGIWCALSPHLSQSFNRFVAEYEFIRNAEGRGSNEAEYYLALPYKDLTGKLSAQWKIRGATYRYFERRILRRLPRRPLRILDLGSGNGWLSYRLSLSRASTCSRRYSYKRSRRSRCGRPLRHSSSCNVSAGTSQPRMPALS